MAGTTNKALLCFCLLMLVALSSATRELSPLLERGDDGSPGDSKTKWDCFRLWDNYCVNNKRCVDKCQGAEGKGHNRGHCELWTCVCCKKKGEDDETVPPTPSPSAQLGPEQLAQSHIGTV